MMVFSGPAQVIISTCFITVRGALKADRLESTRLVPTLRRPCIPLDSHFDCNYGNQQIPWDWLFGSYASKPADLKKIWGRDKPSGPEDDTTKKHASSLSKFMVQ